MTIGEFVKKDEDIIKSFEDIASCGIYTIRAKIESRGLKIVNDIRINIFLINLPVKNQNTYPAEILTIANIDSSMDFIEVKGQIIKKEESKSVNNVTLSKYIIVSSDILTHENFKQYLDIL